MDSLEAKTTNLSASFQKLANDIISKELVGSILDLTKGLTDLADTGIGRVLTKTALFAGAGFGLSQLNAVTKFLPTIISQFTTFSAVLEGTVTYGAKLGGTLVTFGSTALPILLAVGVAIFGIAEAVKAIQEYNAAHTLEAVGQKFQDETGYVKEYNDKLDEAKEKLEALQDVDVGDRTQQWADEKAHVEELIEYYDYLLGLHEQEQAQAAQEYRVKGKAVGYQAVIDPTAYQYNYGSYDANGSAVEDTNPEHIKALATSYDTLNEAVFGLSRAFGINIELTGEMETDIGLLRDALEKTGITIDGIIVSSEEYNQIQTDRINNILEEIQGVTDLTAVQREQQLALLDNNRLLFDTLVASDNLTDSEEALKQSYIDLMTATGTLNQYLVDLANTLGIDITEAASKLGIAFGNSTGILLTDFQKLEDGTWALRESLDETTDSANDTASAIDNIANASYTGSQEAWQLAQELLGIGTNANEATRATYDLVAQEIIFNNTGIDVSQQISALQALATQAGIAADAIASVTNPEASIARAGQSSGYITEIDENGNAVTKKVDQNTAKQWALQTYYQNLMSQATGDLKPLSTTTNTKSTGGGGGSVQKAKEKAKDAVDEVSSYTSNAIQDTANELEEQAKKTLEKISKAVKEFYDERINALKEQNEEIDKQVQLEEKLRALEEAKNKQVLLYENGEYHYGQDLGAIAAAQKDYDKFVADMERDAQIKVLEDTRDKILKVLEQIEENLDSYSEQQLSYISGLSSSITSSVSDISSIVGGTATGIFAVLQSLLSGVDIGSSGSSLDLSALLNSLGISGLGNIASTTSSSSSTWEALNAPFGRVSAESIERAFRAKLRDERNWRNGQLLSMAYMADTDIPLDVQWWMSIFEAEMADQIRGGTGNIGGGADPRNLDPDAAKHVDINYWLDAIANAKDLYEAMDYYARAQAAGYVLAEFAEGYFDELGWKNFDPKSIYQDMRDAYRRQYIENTDAVLMTRFHQYYSKGAALQSNAGASAWYFNENDLLNDALYSALTGEQMYRLRSAGGSTGLDKVQHARLANDYEKLDADQKARYESEARANREYLVTALSQQIAENSAAWFGASPEEQQALHNANEIYREYLSQLESGNYEGLGGWNYSPIQGALYENQQLARSGVRNPEYSNMEVVMYRNGELIGKPEDVAEVLDDLGTDMDYDSTMYAAAQSAFADQISNGSTTNYNINIDNISLPDVSDSNGFITGLRNLAYQYAYTRQ